MNLGTLFLFILIPGCKASPHPRQTNFAGVVLGRWGWAFFWTFVVYLIYWIEIPIPEKQIALVGSWDGQADQR